MTTYVSPSPGQKVQADLARSWLLVNAAQPARFQAAEDSAADVVLYDIEDAVAPKDKDRARQHVVDQFSNGHTGWVRINGYGTQWWEQDVTELAKYISHELDGPQENGGLVGVMLAMVESSDHVNETAARLPGVPIVALVETARGLQRINSIAAARGTFRLAFGVGDFRRDTGFGSSPRALAYARSQFTIASKAAMLPAPIDGPTQGTISKNLIQGASIAAEFGFRGKLCLLPEQTATINSGLSPSQEELTWSHDFLADFKKDGGQIRNGSDLPRLSRANSTIELAEALGIEWIRPDSDDYSGTATDPYP
ncbi:HpcH/HpaI aldolase/citrate lyase family protein [Enteractinococcus helveticum]|uniref:Aldolase n=1 Tax=Enteractinococcus helveticum TaxID=1837282 RepID=A0A1B7LUJ6_9MICC|nr:CoA ester lyase [Enteractinococcus helveticum]OAV51057.1 aldolase [Enteractinococcus helveticum]